MIYIKKRERFSRGKRPSRQDVCRSLPRDPFSAIICIRVSGKYNLKRAMFFSQKRIRYLPRGRHVRARIVRANFVWIHFAFVYVVHPRGGGRSSRIFADVRNTDTRMASIYTCTYVYIYTRILGVFVCTRYLGRSYRNLSVGSAGSVPLVGGGGAVRLKTPV